MKTFGFKTFLLAEGQAYFGQRVGDILNALQDLEENGKSIGARQVLRHAEGIVNQIRRMLHTNWPKEEEKSLIKLQKIAVALAKTIDPQANKAEKDDIATVISNSKAELESLSGELGVPLNTTSKEGEESPKDAENL
jgi:hypothetical protein